jgi:hypothetical protein
MKNVHFGHCLIGVAVAVVLLVALGVKASTVGFLAIVLACPLMMFLMMRMMGNQPTSTHDDARPVDQGQEH